MVFALATGGAAFALGRQQSAPRSATAAVFLAVAAACFMALANGPASADDGGAIECRGNWPNNCPGVDRVFEEGFLGAIAAGVGAVVGAAVGTAAGEDDDDEDDEGVGGMCSPPDLDDDDEYAIEWEWVEVPMTSGGTRSKKEFDSERMARRIEESRQKALAKSREFDKLEEEIDELDNKLSEMQRKVDDTLSAKPWSELTNAERASTKRNLIATMRAQGQSKAAIERTVGLMESDPGLSKGDFMMYLLGEIVVQTPGETWEAGSKTVKTVVRELGGSGELLSNLGTAYMEDLGSGKQIVRLTSPFTAAYEYYRGKSPTQIQADFAEVARITGDSSIKVSKAGAKQFASMVDSMYEAQTTGNVPGIAQPVAQVGGLLISDTLLTLGLGKAMNLGKKGLSALAARHDLKLLEQAAEVERNLARGAGGTRSAPGGTKPVGPGSGAPHLDDYVKAPMDTPIDSPEKLGHFGALPDEARSLQRVANEEGVIVEMRPGGRERAKHLANGNVGQKGQYNHSNTVKADDLELGLGFRDKDVGLAGGLTPEMYAKLDDPAHFGSLSPKGQARAKWRMDEYKDRRHEVTKLAEGKLERVPDPASPSGRSTVKQQRVRDKFGVDRDPVTGRADTGDFDIGDIRLPDRSFFHDAFGNPLKDHAALRADQAKYNAVVKRLMAEVGDGSIRHPGGYWRPKIKVIKNKKTGLPELNCGDVKTNRRINHKNSATNPDAEANLRFKPGGDTPTASYRETSAPRYDQPLPGE